MATLQSNGNCRGACCGFLGLQCQCRRRCGSQQLQNACPPAALTMHAGCTRVLKNDMLLKGAIMFPSNCKLEPYCVCSIPPTCWPNRGASKVTLSIPGPAWQIENPGFRMAWLITGQKFLGVGIILTVRDILPCMSNKKT